MSEKINYNWLGIGFLEALTLVFVTAKLFGAIAWSWWFVLMPIWLPITTVFGIVGLVYLLARIIR